MFIDGDFEEQATKYSLTRELTTRPSAIFRTQTYIQARPTERGRQERTLILDVATRWNSTFALCDRAIEDKKKKTIFFTRCLNLQMTLMHLSKDPTERAWIADLTTWKSY